jgi:hypothetical protein
MVNTLVVGGTRFHIYVRNCVYATLLLVAIVYYLEELGLCLKICVEVSLDST